MALVVEDGTGLSDAESYRSVADADLYMAAHYPSTHAWNSLVTADKERHLRNGAQYLDGKYRHRYIGVRHTSDQALLWPRSQAYDADGYTLSGIPAALKNAQTEVARRLAEGTDVNPDLSRGGAVKAQKVGEIEIEYMDGAAAGTLFRQIDQILGGLISGGDRVIAS